MATDHNFKVKKGIDVLGGDVNLGDGFSYKIDGTTVVDSSRNLANIGTVSSGSITSSGQIFTTQESSSALKSRFLMGKASGSTANGELYLQYGSSDRVYIGAGSGGAGLTVAGSLSGSSGNMTGKFAVMSTGVHASYDLYNNGTSYFNGAVIVDDNLTVSGNLTVNGTTTTLNTATLDVEDKNITLNYSTGDSSGSADGAGITIQDAVDSSTDATILWDSTYDEFGFSHPISVVGNSTFAGSATDSTSAATFKNSAGTAILRVRNDGRVLIPSGYLYAQSSEGIYSTGSIKARGGITNDGGNNLSISSGGSDITFNSKNFTSVGTISSGAITTTGDISLNKADGFVYLNNVGTGNSGIYVRGITSSNTLRSHSTDNFRWEVSGAQKMELDSSGNLDIAGNLILNNNSAKFAAPVYRGTASSVSNAGYTTLFTVTGSSLASTIRMTLAGTASSVVVNLTADITVGHYQDILITSRSGFYTTVTLKVTSDNNEDFAVEATTNHATGVTLAIEVFPLNNEAVTFTSSHSYTGQSHTHTCSYGVATSGAGGNSGDHRTRGRHFIQDGSIASPGLIFENDHDTGFYRVGSNSLGIVAAGSRKFYVNSTNAYFQNLSGGVHSKRVTLGTGSSDAGELYVNDTSTTSYTLGLLGTGTRGYTFRGSSSSGDYSLTFENAGTGAFNTTFRGHTFVAETGADSTLEVIGDTNYDPVLTFSSNQNSIATEGFQIWYDNSVGDVHLHTTYAHDDAYIRFHTRTGASKSTSNERLTIAGHGTVGINKSSGLDSSYKLDMGGHIKMNNNHIHYANEVHFNSGTRFKTSNTSTTLHRSSHATASFIALDTNGTIRGYVAGNSDSGHSVGLLDQGGNWAVRHINDQGTIFYSDGGTEQGAIGEDLVGGDYGSMVVKDYKNSWAGYSINDQWVFMSSGAAQAGIYNDTNNEWAIRAHQNAEVNIYHNGSIKIATSSGGATVTGTVEAGAYSVDNRKFIDMPSNSAERGAWNPIVSSIRGSGRVLYNDEDFSSGLNSVGVYNNSGGGTVTITREAATTNSGGSAPNSSGQVLNIYWNGGTASPNRGGFIQSIPSEDNHTFVQIFQAKAPSGSTLHINENSQGTNNTSYWLTNNTGTGEWEWYARVSHCGDSGTFSSGGHVSISGPSSAFSWYLASCTVVDVTETPLLWSAYNDGSGSGLDADTVDGLHESTFMRKSANSGLDMNNNNITEINSLTIADPGPTEGLTWAGGNGWKIVESPNDMSTNSGGNLQLATSARRVTITTDGDIDFATGRLMRSDHHLGHLEGSYNNVAANSAKTNPIYTIGSNYNPSATSLSGMYGVGYAHPNLWGTGSGKNVGWGMYVVENSTVNFIAGRSGTWSLNQYSRNGNTVWDAGNDGAGSGLDADLLDGQQGSYYLTPQATNINNSGTNMTGLSDGWYKWSSSPPTDAPFSYGVMLQLADAAQKIQLAFGGSGTGKVAVRRADSGTFYDWANFWNEDNDGSGSGLDADLLDGQHASAFLTAEANSFLGDGGNASTHPGTNKLIFSGQVSSGTGVLGMPTTNNANAFLNINKHSGEYNSQLGFSSNGNVYYRNFNNTAINSSATWRTIWDSGNDGSGSGLDADTVDGSHASDFMSDTGMADNADVYMNFRVIRNNNSSSHRDGMYIGYSNSNSGHTRLFGGGATSGGLYIRGSGANDLTYGNNTGVIWHSANDGSGTGLDADLLDGYHLSGSTSIATKIFNNKGQNHSTVTNFNTAMTPGPNYVQSYTNGPENTGQWYGFMLGLGNEYGTTTGSSGHYASQMYFKRNASNNANYLYMRSMESGTWQNWLKVSAGYADSAGSATNADTVDNLHASAFLRSNAADEATGDIEFSGGAHFGSSAEIGIGDNAYAYTSVGHNASNNEGIFWHTSASYGIWRESGNWSSPTYPRLIINWPVGIDINGGSMTNGYTHEGVNIGGGSNSALRVNGNTVWHAGNDGSGSGLDADLLDGQQLSALQQAYARVQGWNPAYSNSDETTVYYDFSERAVVIDSYNDTSIGAAYKAIPVNAGEQIKFNVQIKGSAAASNGLYVRLYYYTGDLPNGKTHVSNSASHTLVQEDTGGDSGWYENGAVTTSYVSFNRTWTAPSTGFVSLVVLNWTGIGTGKVYVKDVSYKKYGANTAGIASFTSGSNATSTTNGAVRITGGLGVGYNVHAGGVVRCNSGFVVNTTTVINSSRVLQNLSSGSGSSGLRFTVGDWIQSTDAKQRFYFASSSHTYYKVGGTSAKHLFRNGSDSTKAEINAGGDAIFSGNVTAYGSPSDIRLKENIEVIPDSIEKVKNLRGITFNYKKDGKRSTGLVAQELQKVLPEAVYETKDAPEDGEDILAIRYGNVVGLLVEALKEQQTQIDNLTTLVNELKEK